MKKWLALALGALLIVTVGCGGNKTTETPQASQKVIKVGTNPDFAPFEFIDGNGQMAGFDLDLIHAIGKKMGVKIEMQNIAWDGLIPAVQSGNVDLAIAGMAITEERKKVLLFSDPYYESGLTIMVPKNSSIQSIKDLEGKKIAVQIGTMSSKKAKEVPNASVREFNTSADAFMELKNGGADAVINHIPVIKYYMLKNGGADSPFKIAGIPLSTASDAIATKKDNKELMDKVNKAMKELKDSGEFDALYEKWFCEKPPKK